MNRYYLMTGWELGGISLLMFILGSLCALWCRWGR